MRKKIYFYLSLKEVVQLQRIHTGNNDGNHLLIATFLLTASIHRKWKNTQKLLSLIPFLHQLFDN